ncbi:hypothetical protein D3C81_1409620 [compost metagenome]
MAEQGGEGDQGFAGLLLHQWQFALLFRYQAFLLGQFQCGGAAGVEAGLHQVQDVLRVGQIELGNACLFAQCQGLRVTVGDAALQGQFDGGTVELAGLYTEHGAVARRAFAAPEVDFVTGAQLGVVIIQRAIVRADVELAVAFAVQQFLPVGIETGLDFREQRGAGNRRAGLGLPDPRNSGAEVMAAQSRLFDQSIQLGAAELGPPLAVALHGTGLLR